MTRVGAAIACLLYRYSGQDDLVLGIRLPPLDGWLPVRCRVSAQRSFAAIAAELGERLAHARQHATQLRAVVAADGFNVALSWGEPSAGTHLPPPSCVELELAVSEHAQGLAGVARAALGTLGAPALRRLATHLACLLESAAQSPNQPIAQLQWMSVSERQRLLYTWNETEREIPAECSIPKLFAAQVARTPDQVAVICGDARLSYAELDRRSNQLARHLAELGLGRADRVVIALERSLELVVGIVAALKLGAVYVPIDPSHPRERNAFLLGDAQPRAVLAFARQLDALGPVCAPTLCLDRDWPEIARHSGSALVSDVAPFDPVVMFYTSGSTGQPKGALLHARGYMNLLHWFLRCTQMSSESRVLLMTPTTFDPSFKSIVGPLLGGAALVLAEATGFDPERLLLTIAEHQVTATFSTPTLLYSLVDWARARDFEQLASLRQLFFGGESTDPQRLRPWFESRHFHCTLYHNYGPCECCDVSTTFTPTPEQLQSYEALPLGRPLPNVRTYVLDGELEPVPVGVVGELYIGGIGVGLGYPNQPELTRSRFLPSHFVPGDVLYKTGDLARWVESGDLLFEGRIDTQIKIRGMRVELGEIEAALCAHVDVQDAVVAAWDQDGD
ncbi:MAG TPA: amino acid adenylation domain-containing protein, partial [Polyangiales bacterium]|nr:amino acid adenylation domain-containing protein [Polyangiales bacterium]